MKTESTNLLTDGRSGTARSKPKLSPPSPDVSIDTTMGLDLSLTRTGLVVVHLGKVVYWDSISTPSFATEEVRFRRIVMRILKAARAHGPVVTAVEAAIGGKFTQH